MRMEPGDSFQGPRLLLVAAIHNKLRKHLSALVCGECNPIESDYDLLNHFEGVHLMALKLGSLSPAVKRLTNVVMLNLSWSDISELPSELYELTQLMGLKLNWTSIANLAPAIGRLPDLAFVEVSETPFLRTIYAIRDADGAIQNDEQRQVQTIVDILDAMECTIDE